MNDAINIETKTAALPTQAVHHNVTPGSTGSAPMGLDGGARQRQATHCPG